MLFRQKSGKIQQNRHILSVGELKSASSTPFFFAAAVKMLVYFLLFFTEIKNAQKYTAGEI